MLKPTGRGVDHMVSAYWGFRLKGHSGAREYWGGACLTQESLKLTLAWNFSERGPGLYLRGLLRSSCDSLGSLSQ